MSGGQNLRLIAERLKSEARNGRTILAITHDRELIESCCDNVVEIGVKPDGAENNCTWNRFGGLACGLWHFCDTFPALLRGKYLALSCILQSRLKPNQND